MAEQLLPEELSSIIAEFDRRLHNLETTARVGLSRTRFVRQFGSADASTYAAWENGSLVADWVDDEGNTGSGYGTLTMTVPSRCLFFLGATTWRLLVAGTYRSIGCQIGISIDGGDPTVAWTPEYPIMYRRLYTGATNYTETPFQFFATRRDLEPGQHSFKVWAWWDNTNPAAPNLPRLVDAFLLVVPLN